MAVTTKCLYEELNYDEACVEISNENESTNASLYFLTMDCVKCPYKRISEILEGANSSIKFNTAKSMTWRVLENVSDDYVPAHNQSGTICELSPNLDEYGIYKLAIKNESCFFDTIREPGNPYIPLFIVLGAIAGYLLGFAILRLLWHLISEKCSKSASHENTIPNKETKKRRVRSIDSFRGISILLMIFVNDGAGGYFILGHATWDGLLVGDFVFPCFLWIMGFCVPLAITAQLSRGATKCSLAFSIIQRSILLFVIGLSLNTLFTGPQLATIRIFGVLQRFSISYLFVALMYTLSSTHNPNRTQRTVLGAVQDLLNLWPQWFFIGIIVVLHSALTFLLPVPGCPSGYLGPGGRHEDGKYWNCTGGTAGYIDKIILGVDHIFQRPTISLVYGSGPFDPEGLLGCLTSIFQVFLGVLAGEIFLSYQNWLARVVRWLAWAIICGCAGSALHFTHTIPINKNLWSLSFALVTSSFAFILLSACYLLIDVTRMWHGGPFRIPGMNALLMYAGHQLCYRIFPFHWTSGKMNTHLWLLIENLWGVILWTIIAYILHRKRTYMTL